MGLSLLADTARLRRLAALLQEGMGEQAPPLPTLVDFLNRALRPLSVLAVFALVGAAFWDPARYAAGMAALRLTPWPVWALAALVLALHFLWPARGQPPRT